MISLEKDTDFWINDGCDVYRKWLTGCNHISDKGKCSINMQFTKGNLHRFLKESSDDIEQSWQCKYTNETSFDLNDMSYEHIVAKSWCHATESVEEFAGVINDPFNITLVHKSVNQAKGTKPFDFRPKSTDLDASSNVYFSPPKMSPEAFGPVARSVLYMLLTYPLLCFDCNALLNKKVPGVHAMQPFEQECWFYALNTKLQDWELAYARYIYEYSNRLNPFVSNSHWDADFLDQLKGLVTRRMKGTDTASTLLANALSMGSHAHTCTVLQPGGDPRMLL